MDRNDTSYRPSAAVRTTAPLATQRAAAHEPGSDAADLAGFSTYRCEWLFQSSPEALWSFVSNTHRLNYETNNPRVREIIAPGTRLPNAYRLIRASLVEFEEQPFEWVRPCYYASSKRFLPSGLRIFDEIRVRTELLPQPDGGTRLIYQMWSRPGNLLGRLLVPLLIRRICRGFEGPIRRYDRSLQIAATVSAPAARAVHFVAGGRERIAGRRRALVAQFGHAELVERLIEHLSSADPLAVATIRPYALADAWSAPRRAVLELCLHATRAGLLHMRWEILCPLCRGAKQRNTSLDTLEPTVHCASCNIDFTANFASSVEVVFNPNPDIRTYEASQFCVGGPQLTPHIVAQQLLPPAGRRALTIPLETGRYRLRTLEQPGSQAITVAASGAQAATFQVALAGWPDDEYTLASPATLELENSTAQEQLMILERTEWSDQATTAAEVTTLQVFRDLFASEALRPRERISVGSLTIMFTDLRESTQLYQQMGDAVAFGHVLNHFDILKAQIAAEGGAIVKTIGDSVMAVFIHPVAALRATLQAQHSLAHPADGMPALQLKAGIHYGPCIAVTLNERLDYFGSTVNLAARLEGLSQDVPGSIVVSNAIYADPEVASYIKELDAAFRFSPFAVPVRGFDHDIFSLWRIQPRSSERSSQA